ncbi:Serine/threonine-protein kinase PrkC [Rubripirellula tenax]|uniref:non-specific serine/threonine protein kinase n=1 Tax=Rubripirellula tenax TaxID=2528015 RepID=A0A5C6EJ33_9BACT|nr:serine/threonine-protein kinase [Rubripirellula tenax]TWU48514.1 Serine/threonine-protein kinase PrkC [Rubripirellula tenax]
MSVNDATDDHHANDESDQDDRVVNAVKQYMSMLDAGQAPSTEDFLNQHAEIADQLRPSLDGLALVHRAAAPKQSGMAAAPDAEFTSKPIGDFQIVGELGRGGMGVVYEAIQLSLGRRVALKVLPFASGLDEVRLQRFRNEAHAAAALHHTNIVPVYAVGSDRGVHFYAMQLIQGQTLADVIEQMREVNSFHRDSPDAVIEANIDTTTGERDARAPVKARSSDASRGTTHSRPNESTLLNTHADRLRYYRTAVKMAHQAAMAIQHAHQYGVIHRDIKPGNLLLDAAGQIWVTDFGLAQIQYADSNMTRTGDPMGTLKYMSPEQAAGKRGEMDHRTDIYSLGITLYELLTLEPAIKGDNYRAMLNQVAEHEPSSPKSIVPSLPIELDTIVRKAIAKAPADRYASAQTFADDLQSWLDDKPIAAKPPSALERLAKWRRRNSGLVATASIVLMAATIGLLVTTLMIYRALDRETQQRELAEESFQQAKSAVDQFSSLSESELAYHPNLQHLRRSFLETSLGFYQDFLEHRSADPGASKELAMTSNRVQKMVEELRLLDNIEPMLMLSNKAVQDDVGVDQESATAMTAAVENFQTQRESLAVRYVGSLQSDDSEMSDLLRAFEKEMSQYVSTSQVNRLRQIARQQGLPFIFMSSEVVVELGLSQDQREAISRIIEETRPGRGDDDRRPGGDRPGDDRPSNDRLGDGFGGDRPPRHGFGGPPGRFGSFERAFSPVTRNTVKHILQILTPEQREKWNAFVGEPFRP